MKRQIKFVLFDEEGCEVEHTLPGRLALCSRCDGEGTHDHPAFANGISSDEWNGPDWDDDSREGYLTGRYDVRCEVCHGSRVETVVDEAACIGELKAVLDAYNQHCEQRAREEAEDRAIRRMESGGRE